MEQLNQPPPLLLGSRPTAGDALEVLQILKTLWRRRLLIALMTLSITVIGYWIVNKLTPRYTAEAVLLLDVSEANSTNEVDTIINGLSKDEALINSQIDIMQSRSLAERVVDQLRLVAYPEFQAATRMLYPRSWVSDGILVRLPAFVRDWLEPEMASPPAPATVRAAIVDYVLNKLEVENDGESYTVQLRYEANDAELAARIADTFAGLYLTTRLEYKQDINGKRGKWLNAKLDDLRQRVVAADRAVQEFREEHNLVDVRENPLVNEQLASLGTELVAATAARLKAESVLRGARAAAASRATSSPQSLLALSQSVAELQASENELRSEIAERRAELGSRHPEIIGLENRLQGIGDRLKQETARALRGFEADLEVARAQEEALIRRVRESEVENETTNRATIQLNQLTAEADAARGLLNSFLEGANQTWAGADVYDPDARILSPATIPQEQSYPPRMLLLLLTVGAALVLAVATVVVLELLDTTYHDPVDLERAHGVPVLGLVPLTRRLTHYHADGNQAYPHHPSSEVIERPWSPFSEAVQSIYTLLTRSTTGRPPGVVLVTSAVPEEGKTSLALALGRLAARAGKRVLLIDCDLRHPCVGRYLGCTNRRGRGLVELLRGEVTLEEALRVDERSGMVFVPATPHCSLPVELLASESMRRLVREASKKFQLVILDSAPVIPVADGLVLAALADATLLAVRWGKTARYLVAAAVKNLAAVGKPVTAAAFSHVHLRQYATYAYGYYPAGYGSAAEPDLDGDSDDPAPQTARPAIQGLMTGPAAVWRAISAASAGPVVLVLIIALILFGYSLYANMTNLDPGPVAAKPADLTGADRPTVAALRASREVPPVVSVPGRALAQDLGPSSGRPSANAASDRPSPLIVALEGRRELTPTASPEPEAGALDGAALDHSEGRSPPPKGEAVELRSAPWVGPDPERLALAQSSAPQIGDLEAPRPGKPAARGSPVGSPPSGVAAPQPSPARPARALPGSEAAYRIQLASYHRQADAERAWQVFSAVLGEELSGLRPNVESADTSRGVFYRLQAGPLATAAAAAAICGRVRQRGADCLVVRSNGV